MPSFLCHLPPTAARKTVNPPISKPLHPALDHASMERALMAHRKRKQKEKKRAARAQQFTIWEDDTATPLSDAALFNEMHTHTRRSCSPGPAPASREEIETLTEPIDAVTAPEKTNADASRMQCLLDDTPLSPEICDAPWTEPEPTSGETWDRLVTDPTFVRNNESVLAFLRVLHRLKNRYPLIADGRVAFPRYGTRQGGCVLMYEDIGRLFNTLEAVEYGNIFDNPVWEGWRTAPGDDPRDAEKDPDMDHVMAALRLQVDTFDRLVAEMETYRSSFLQYISCHIAEQYDGITPVQQELGRPLTTDEPWEERPEESPGDLNIDGVKEWSTEWTWNIL